MHAKIISYLSLFPILFISISSARQFNITIDDQDGDPSNGNHIIYTPSSAWNIGQNCTACTAKVTPQSDAYLGTWMDTTFNPSGNATNDAPGQVPQASVNFVGTAVYVVCILTGTSTSPDANSDMTFIIDGNTVGSFEKAPDGDTTYNFNQIVFSTSDLSNDSHTLEIQTGLKGQKALLLLDAIIYTVDDGTSDSTTTSSSTSILTITTSTSPPNTPSVPKPTTVTQTSSTVITSIGASGSTIITTVIDQSSSIATGTSSGLASNSETSSSVTIHTTSDPSNQSDIVKSNNKGVIGGSVAAAAIVLVLIGVLIFCFRRRRQKFHTRRVSGENITPLGNSSNFVSHGATALPNPETLRNYNTPLRGKGYGDAIFTRGARNFAVAPGGAAASAYVESTQAVSTDRTLFSDNPNRISLPAYSTIDWPDDHSQQMRGSPLNDISMRKY